MDWRVFSHPHRQQRKCPYFYVTPSVHLIPQLPIVINFVASNSFLKFRSFFFNHLDYLFLHNKSGLGEQTVDML